MTTEDKALKLLNDCGGDVLVVIRNGNAWVEALCRAIEQHEAFRQEVSDIVYAHVHVTRTDDWEKLKTLIIPAPKPDPLVEVLDAIDVNQELVSTQEYADQLRASLDARGFEIREKNDD